MTIGKTLILIFIIYYLLINLIGLILMGVDKRKAIKGAYRLPEATLFCTALLGGALGTTLGMRIFRHKTKHWYFKYGLPVILILQVILLVLLSYFIMCQYFISSKLISDFRNLRNRNNTKWIIEVHNRLASSPGIL